MSSCQFVHRSLTMPEAVPASRRIRNVNVYGHVNKVSNSHLSTEVDVTVPKLTEEQSHNAIGRLQGRCCPTCEGLQSHY